MKKHRKALMALEYLFKPDLKMKLTYFFFVVFLMQSYANGYGQNLISLDVENATLEQIIEQIEGKTSYRFLYNTKDVNLNRRVSLSAYKQRINTVIDKVFKGTDISYIVTDKQIVLRIAAPKTVNKVQPSTKEIPQEQQLMSGIITDKNGLPLAGVTVLVKGTQRGVATDFDGLYEIEAQDGETLVFSYLGFLDFELIVGEVNSYDISLIPTSLELQGVEVVSTGYQTISKERSTGSFERVEEKTLDLKINQNIFSKIEGEVAGVTTDTDGRFIIRGLSSINANTDPLVVVDGFPIEQGINTINPNDVESITILKDAAAASIWGIRATNGVIVIITKKGNRNGKLSVNASVNTAITPKANIFDAPLGDPSTQVAYQQAIFNNGGFYEVSDLFSGDLNANSGRVLNPVAETLLQQERGDITAAEAQARLQQLSSLDSRREYNDIIQNPQIWRQYNMSISGGTEKYDFRASISYNGNDKEFVNTNADQYLINFANSFNITSKLKVSGSINFSQSKENFTQSFVQDGFGNPGVSSAGGFLSNVPITSQIIDGNGNFVPMENFFSFGTQSSDLALQRGFPYPWTYNIKQELDNADNVLRETALRLNTGINYTIFKGLNINAIYQYEWSQQNNRDFHNEKSFYTRSRVNLFSNVTTNIITNPDTFESFNRPIARAIPEGGILDLDARNQRSHTFRTQLNYNGLFGENKHQITAIAGYEVRKTIFERTTDRKYGFDPQSLLSVRPDFASNFDASFPLINIDLIPENSINEFIENRFISYYANAAYTFDNRYTLSASTRLDDTNLFGTSDRYKNIPLYSLGFKWNVVNDFFENNETINALQFRATYGTNGNVDRSTSPFLQARIKRGFFPFTNLNADLTSAPNPELRLEKTRALNLGLDFSLFNYFASGSIEYYIKDSEDLLAFTSLNPTSGLNGALINNGTLRNEGIDANLSLKVVNSDNFRYTTTGNFSINTNTLKEVEVPTDLLSDYISGNVAVPGAALRTIYSYNYAGLDRNGAPQFVNEEGGITDFTTAITDVDALINEGSVIPKYYGSWINNFEYKNLYLRALTTFKAGHVFRYGGTNITYIPATFAPHANVPADFNNRWQNSGDEDLTDIPAIPAFSDRSEVGYRNYQDSDKFVDTAAHIRLSQLSFGYRFPTNTLEKLGVSNLQIGLQADNVAVWNFNKWDVDPESFFIPLQPRYTLNISASF